MPPRDASASTPLPNTHLPEGKAAVEEISEVFGAVLLVILEELNYVFDESEDQELRAHCGNIRGCCSHNRGARDFDYTGSKVAEHTNKCLSLSCHVVAMHCTLDTLSGAHVFIAWLFISPFDQYLFIVMVVRDWRQKCRSREKCEREAWTVYAHAHTNTHTSFDTHTQIMYA